MKIICLIPISSEYESEGTPFPFTEILKFDRTE